MVLPSAPLPAARTWPTLVGLLLVAWAFTCTVGNEVLLDAAETVEARCGENQTLTCNTSTALDNTMMFAWAAKGQVLCDKKNKTSGCQLSSHNGLQTLAMTLTNIRPEHFGDYICKLHTKFDTFSRLSKLIVTACPIRKRSYMNQTFAVCEYKDIQMYAEVHWFVEGIDLTGSAGVDVTRKPGDFFDISSSMMLTVRRPRHECRLWNIEQEKYVEGQTMVVGSASPFWQSPASWSLVLLVLILTL